MNEVPEPKPRLTPARPADDAEAAPFMPRVPYRLLLALVAFVGLIAGGYWLKQAQRESTLRAQILRVHEELQPSRERYLTFRAKVEKLVLSAAGRGGDAFVDKRLRIEGLRSGRGIYLRVPAAALADAKALGAAASSMQGDVINACMGLSPTSARGLFELGDFLLPERVKEAREQTGVMHLRVADEVLARQIRTDLPAVMSVTSGDWLLLVVEQGPNRRDHPVDVFLWDLRDERELLRARIQSDGALMPVRVRSEGAPGAPRLRPENLAGSGASDCSIAMQIKQLAGGKVAEMQNAPTPTPEPTPAPELVPEATAEPTPPAHR